MDMQTVLNTEHAAAADMNDHDMAEAIIEEFAQGAFGAYHSIPAIEDAVYAHVFGAAS